MNKASKEIPLALLGVVLLTITGTDSLAPSQISTAKETGIEKNNFPPGVSAVPSTVDFYFGQSLGLSDMPTHLRTMTMRDWFFNNLGSKVGLMDCLQETQIERDSYKGLVIFGQEGSGSRLFDKPSEENPLPQIIKPNEPRVVREFIVVENGPNEFWWAVNPERLIRDDLLNRTPKPNFTLFGQVNNETGIATRYMADKGDLNKCTPARSNKRLQP